MTHTPDRTVPNFARRRVNDEDQHTTEAIVKKTSASEWRPTTPSGQKTKPG